MNIKVEIYYKVSMHNTDWMMNAEEYDEFRKSANNLPVFFTGPKIKEEEDQAEECPEYIEPPEIILEPVVVCEGNSCQLVYPEEAVEDNKSDVTIRDTIEKVQEPGQKVQEPIQKAQKQDKKKPGRKTSRDFSKYIQMYEAGVDQREIKNLIKNDFQITNITADQYFYTKVKKMAKEPEMSEKEKKRVDPALFNSIDSMPHYPTPQQFKDACASSDIGRGKYSIKELKEIYLDTHSAVRW